ncbi:MAG: MMPL family transporter [Deltaproteobacteria bacterium]|nr:MMPL family transporter [Deltaproteobacteria bacterium]
MSQKNLRWRIEAHFERWGHWVARHPAPVLAIMLAFSVLCIANLRNLEFDTSVEGMLLEGDPVLIAFVEFQEEFGNDDRALIAIRSDRIFSFAFLEKLRALHEDLEANVVHLDEIDSLINARSTRGAEDELIVEDLFEDWPEDEAALAEIRDRALANPLYTNFLISESCTYTTLSLRLNTYSGSADPELSGFEESAIGGAEAPARRSLLTVDEMREAVISMREVVARHESPDFPLSLVGGPVMNERLFTRVSGDMVRFLGLSILAAATILFVLFRRVSGTLLPIGVVLLALLSTMGVAPWFGVPIQLTTQILPSFLLAVGVGGSVHILTIFYQRLVAGEARQEAIASAFGHSGLAVLMTSLTTAGALFSFTFASMAHAKNLGVLAPLGVLFALLYTVTVLPALLALLPIRANVRRRARLVTLDRILAICARISTERPWAVVGTALVVLAAALLGTTQLRFSHNPLHWFPEGDPFRSAMEELGDEMRGGTTLEVLFESDEENRLYDPGVLGKMEALQKESESLNFQGIPIGQAISIVDILKEINQALNENRSEYRRIPEDRQLIAQELLLFENSGADDLADFSDSLFSTGRMTLRAPYADSLHYAPLVRHIQQTYAERMGPGTKVTVTGIMPLLTRTFEAMVESMSISYVIAVGIIAPLMMLVLASVRLGALSMFPNLLPIVLTLALMAIAGIPLDALNLLIGSIALGLAVDDTIHFMHGFNRYYAASGDAAEAVRSTLATSGQAMFVTTLVLCSGFLVFTVGYLHNTFYFGVLTAASLGFAFVADVLLAPALMVLATRSREPTTATELAGAPAPPSAGMRRR